MRNKLMQFRGAALLALITSSVLFTGCATQTIDLSQIKQGKPTGNLQHFKESGTSVYMLLDLVDVSPVAADELVAKANPEGKPVTNLKVTSEEGPLAVLVNILNGGIIDRGVIISLNNVTVEGDIVLD